MKRDSVSKWLIYLAVSASLLLVLKIVSMVIGISFTVLSIGGGIVLMLASLGLADSGNLTQGFHGHLSNRAGSFSHLTRMQQRATQNALQSAFTQDVLFVGLFLTLMGIVFLIF